MLLTRRTSARSGSMRIGSSRTCLPVRWLMHCRKSRRLPCRAFVIKSLTFLVIRGFATPAAEAEARKGRWCAARGPRAYGTNVAGGPGSDGHIAGPGGDRVDHPPATRRPSGLRPRRDLSTKESCHEYRLACWGRSHHSRGTQLLRLALVRVARSVPARGLVPRRPSARAYRWSLTTAPLLHCGVAAPRPPPCFLFPSAAQFHLFRRRAFSPAMPTMSGQDSDKPHRRRQT